MRGLAQHGWVLAQTYRGEDTRIVSPYRGKEPDTAASTTSQGESWRSPGLRLQVSPAAMPRPADG